MARIAGVDLPNKAVKIALTYIYGIGRVSAADICKKTNIDPDVRINTLSADELALLRKVIEEEYKIEGHLRTEVALNIGCYRGLRHRKGLPVRGQRTKTNARTRKGRKKTVANKKK